VQFDDFTPLWARIGYFLGDAAWAFAMVLLFVAGIGLFKAARHKATRSLKMTGFALIAWVVLTMIGTVFHKAAAHPAIANELGYTGMHAVNVVIGLAGGVIDFVLFALACMGAIKAGRGVRVWVAMADEAAPVAAKPPVVAKPPVAQPPVVAKPPVARAIGTTAATDAPRPAPLPQPVPVAQPAPVAAAPVVASPMEHEPKTLETMPLAEVDAVVTAEDRPKPASRSSELEALVAAGGFAKPQKVFTLKEASSGGIPSLVSQEQAGLGELDDTREVALSSLPLLADEDEHLREATLVEFPAVPPARPSLNVQ